MLQGMKIQLPAGRQVLRGKIRMLSVVVESCLNLNLRRDSFLPLSYKFFSMSKIVWRIAVWHRLFRFKLPQDILFWIYMK